MSKFVFLLLFVFVPFYVQAKPDYYLLNNNEGCYVKEYVNKKFLDVPKKKFLKYRINAVPHKKNKNYMFFKSENRTYVTLKRCLNDISIETMDEDDFASLKSEDVLDSDREENYDHINRKVHKYQMENLRFSENNWYVELDFGKFSIGDKNQVYPKYTGYTETDTNGDTVTLGEVKKSKYKAGNSISLAGGYRYSDSAFVAFKFKRYSGKKEENVDFTGTLSGVNVQGTLPFEFKDTFTSFLVGNKFVFFPDSHLRPIIGFYAGLSLIDSEWSYLDQEKVKIRSTGITAQLDLGLEYFFTNHVAIGTTFSYEYLGQRKFRSVDGDNEITDKGFTSKMSYSNYSLLAGLKVYFQ